MPEILIIGKDLINKDFAFLATYGRIVKFKSINDLNFNTADSVALLIVEKTQSKENFFKEFSKRTSYIPKLIISSDHSFRGFGPWLKLPLTFPAFDPDDHELLFLAGRLISERNLQMDNRKLKEKLTVARLELDLFEEIGKVLSSGMEMEDMLFLIMKNIKKAVRAGSWSIFLLDEESGELVLKQTDDRKGKLNNLRVKFGEGIAGWVFKEGIPLVIPDVSRDERCLHGPEKQGHPKTSSLVSIPIKSKDRTVGVIEFKGTPAAGPFTKVDVELLTSMVDYAGVAIKVASLYQKMAELSVTDDLTKLFNSRYLNRTIEVEMQRSERSRTSVSLIFMDIDHFKLVNDHHGHLMGSKLLVEVGQLLLNGLRSIDIVARYGGDEFVIVLPQTPASVASEVAERIRKAMEQNTFMKKEGYALRITASFGVASYPEGAKTKEELLKLADEAMYRVKNASGNGVYAII